MNIIDAVNKKTHPPDSCPICGAEEVEANTPRTVYKCGSSDYDGRPGAFKQKCSITNVGVNEFVKRQTKESRFSYYDGPLTEVAALAESYLATGVKGYRDGVLQVDVPPKNFYSGVVQLKPGDKLSGIYESRRQGEDPRKQVGAVNGEKIKAKAVNLILYRADVLAEGNDRTTDCQWELISINARATDEPEPINVGALIANHFGADGGTATKLNDTEFVNQLRFSFEYWKDKAMLAD